jgi:hypothetical protein
VFALRFQVGGIAVFIHWRVAAEFSGGRLGWRWWRSSGGLAQLPYVTGVDGRSDQLRPRLPLCPLRRRRRGAGPAPATAPPGEGTAHG